MQSIVRTILIDNGIDAYTEVAQSEWPKIINKKTLFNALLGYYFTAFDDHLFRQFSWIKKNDVPTEEREIGLRQEFLQRLLDIRGNDLFFIRGPRERNSFEEYTVDKAIKFKFQQVKELSDEITKTDIEPLKDQHSLKLIEIVSGLLKLCMNIFCPLYFDPVISNKCKMEHSLHTIWSGKSLNTVHMEHLQANFEQLEKVYATLSENLQQEDSLNEDMRLPPM